MDHLSELIDQLARLYECIGETIVSLTAFELEKAD